MDALTVSFISALTALFASILGPSVSVYVARRQINANVLSAGRQKWMEQLRDQIGALIAQLSVATGIVDGLDDNALDAFAKDPQMLPRVESLVTTVAKIRLMLNPSDARHQELFSTMQIAVERLQRPGSRFETLQPEMRDLCETIMRQTQEVLANEWQRVKRGN